MYRANLQMYLWVTMDTASSCCCSYSIITVTISLITYAPSYINGDRHWHCMYCPQFLWDANMSLTLTLVPSLLRNIIVG